MISISYFSFAVGYGILLLLIAFFKGFPLWAAEQILIFIMLIGVFPFLQKIPVIRSIDDNAERLFTFYKENPKFLSSTLYYVLRLIPIVYLFVFWKEVRLLIKILFFSVPLDILLEFLWNWISDYPSVNFFSEPEFWILIMRKSVYSVYFLPLIVAVAAGIRKGFSDYQLY